MGGVEASHFFKEHGSDTDENSIDKKAIGIGLRSPHYQASFRLLSPSIGFLEIHSENYFNSHTVKTIIIP